MAWCHVNVGKIKHKQEEMRKSENRDRWERVGQRWVEKSENRRDVEEEKKKFPLQKWQMTCSSNTREQEPVWALAIHSLKSSIPFVLETPNGWQSTE